MTPYILTGDALANLLWEFGVEVPRGVHEARFAIDDGGLKVSVNRGTWTLPLGKVDA